MGAEAILALLGYGAFFAAVLVIYRMKVTERPVAMYAALAAFVVTVVILLMGRPENIPFLRITFLGPLAAGTLALLHARRYGVAVLFGAPLVMVALDRNSTSDLPGLIVDIAGNLIIVLPPLAAIFVVGAFFERGHEA